ncbi:hypothetical protein G4Y79_12255 [Phototrophicus methaneseepsis]|uniref:histidine kinase n=1 Tax=Phototrophicus methaneseepsis TaxID=2710758 RepID=A0A7S8ICN0_9CHLR|nr:HAMP domain-containing sensor histidine kinase [Phototrophicus methaneseepsis]QPC80489.1 hypothetical protein G4Y79_12255 [Phototrophicus methaneseepsis]
MAEPLVAILGVIIAALVYILYRQRRLFEHQQQALQDAQRSASSLTDAMKESERDAARLREELAKERERIHALRQQAQKQDLVLANLTEQISKSEEDSLQSKALYSTIANVAYDLVFLLDEDMTVIALNKAADTFFDQKNPIGEKFTDIVDAPEFDMIIRGALDEYSFEEQLTYHGQYYKVRTQLMPYSDGKRFIGVAMQNITQLVRLNRARRDMVANISHELRNPIATIRLKIDSLFDQDSKVKRKDSIQALRDIDTQTDSLERMVQELLDLSMIESGQALMKLVPQPLHEIVQEAVARQQEHLDVKSLKTVTHIPQRIEVLADRDHIRRVFVNLIGNAIKYSPEKESIMISAQTNEDEVLISIFDNGPGVPDDQRERIFERFYQVDTARSKREGSGLGLAISKHIVEHHGGRIWAEGNSQGSGGRFMFTLLNANPSEPGPEMDRGQHDFPLQPGVVTSDLAATSEDAETQETSEEENIEA